MAQESFLDRFDPVTRLKFVSVLLCVLALILLLSALSHEDTTPAGKTVKIGDIYTVNIPYKYNRTYYGNTTILFTGEYSKPETMIIIDPEIEPDGEFTPLDKNPEELRSQLVQTLSIADIEPAEIKLVPPVQFEFSLMPVLEFDFSFGNYIGICYFFMAREYSFTVVCMKRRDVKRDWMMRNIDKLAFFQLVGKYRTPVINRAVINSADIAYCADDIIQAKNELVLARRLAESQSTSMRAMTAAVRAYEKAFKLFAENDEANLISEKDTKIFFELIEKRQNVFSLMKSEMNSEYVKGNLKEVRKQLAEMKKLASLESDQEWREWAKRQEENIIAKESAK